jgi:hypothetical protein
VRVRVKRWGCCPGESDVDPPQTERRNLPAGELPPNDVIQYSQLAQLLASAGIPLDEQRVTVLCADLHEQHRRELLPRYQPADPARVYLAAFGSPFDAEVVDRIPADHRDAAVEGILARLLHEPQPSAREAIAWAQHRSAEENASAAAVHSRQWLFQRRHLQHSARAHRPSVGVFFR